MKKMTFLGLLLYLANLCQAQKHDYNWLLGHIQGTLIDFNEQPAAIVPIEKEAAMGVTNVTMSDAEGNLIFYTNGCNIYNAEHEVMDNGVNINPGSVHNDQCFILGAYTAISGAISFLEPNSDSLFYLFHQRIVLFTQPTLDAYSDRLLLSKIDMKENGGLGKVIEKNVLVIEDTLQSGDLTGIKHANGEDWWIVSPKRTSNKYYFILLTEDGITDVQSQIIGDSTEYVGDGGGQAVFSPDGNLFIKYSPPDGIFLFDFDRSTGELSNYRHIEVAGDSAFAGGMAISPSSRFLYISGETKFWQFDLEAADIGASQVLLAEYDGFESPFPATFRHCQLAPDCKIYCVSHSSTDVLHVVNHPDEPGLACDFQQHGVQLPGTNYSLPNFPNYRLGSGQFTCTPVSATEAAGPALQVRVWPNPASGPVQVELALPLAAAGEWRLYGSMGQLVFSGELASGQAAHSFQLEGLPPGLYFWEVRSEGRRAGSDQPLSGKLVLSKN